MRKHYVVLFGSLLLLAWLGWKLFWVVSGRPGVLVDYTLQMKAISEGAQPQGENGWPALSAGLAHFFAIGDPPLDGWPSDRDESGKLKDMSALVSGSFDPSRVRREIAYAEFIEQSSALREIQEALNAPRFVRTEFNGAEEGLIGLLLPELAQARSLAKVRRGSMRLAAEQRDAERLVSAWHDLNRLSVAMSCDPFVICQLVAGSIVQIANEEMNCLLIEHRLDETTCRKLLAVLDGNNGGLSLEIALEGERLVMYDLIQRTHTDDGHGDGLLIPREIERFSGHSRWTARFGSVDHPLANVIGIVYPGRAETRGVIDTFMDAAVRQIRLSRWERQADPIELATFSEELPERQVFARFFLPAISRVVDSSDGWRARVSATHVAIAIELYEAIHDCLPDSLAQLVPECLDGLPTDPVSGLPFGYMRRDPTAADPRTYLLYSLGVDREDNSAVETDDDPTAALIDEIDGGGFDYVFNRLRKPMDHR